MKTHLPVALRKALLAALVAVSAFAYNRAFAENITTADQIRTVTGDTAIEIEEVSTAAENLTLKSENGDISISKIVASGMTDVDKQLGNLNVTSTGGSLSIGAVEPVMVNNVQTPLTFSDVYIDVAGDLTIGTTGTDAGPMRIRGEHASEINVGGNMTVHQNISVFPGVDIGNSGNTNGTSHIDVEGELKFLGSMTSIQGGNADDSTQVTAKGNVVFENSGGTTIADNAIVSSETGDISIDNELSKTDISGDLYSYKGNIKAGAAIIEVAQEDGKTVVFRAEKEIELAASQISGVGNSDFEAEDITVSGQAVYVTASKMSGSDTVAITGSDATFVKESSVLDSGLVTIGGTTGDTGVDASSISSDENVNIGGASVAVTQNKGISTTGGDVSITATGADVAGAPALYVQGGFVEASGDVKMVAETGNAKVKSVDVEGDSVTIKGKASTIVADVEVEASSIAVGDADSETTVKMGSSLEASNGIGVTGTTTKVIGGTVESKSGHVSISGSEHTSVEGVAVSGASIAVGDAAGSTTVKANSTLEAVGAVEVTGTTTKVIGGTVESKSGDVSISGSEHTSVEGVAVSGASIAVGDAAGSTTVKDDSSLEAVGAVEVTGTTTKVIGGTVESKSGDVTITGSTLASVESSTVSGRYVDITGKKAVVSGQSVTGTEDVTIAGTEATTVDEVLVKGATITVGESGATVVKSGSSFEATGDIKVTGEHVKVAQSNLDSSLGEVVIKSVGVDADAPALYVHGSTIESADNVELVAESGSAKVKDTSIEGSDVTLRGESSTTVAKVQVDASTISVGDADSETTVKMGSSLEADGRIDITGSTTKLVDSSVESKQGEVVVSAADAGLLSAATVSGDDVALNGGDIEVNNGTSVEADKGSIVAVVETLTVGTARETETEDYLTARKEVSIIVHDAATIQGAAKVEAQGGAVTFAGGKTSTNTITGTDTLVEATGNVDMSGATNTIESGAKVDAGANVNMLAADTDDAATATNTISRGTVQADGNVSLQGEANIVAGAAEVSARDGYVALAGDANTISGAAQVKAGDGAVTLAGETNTITGTDTLVEATGNVDISGATNTIESGAMVDAGENVNMLAADTDDAATATNTISGGTVQAEDNVSLLGEANVISDDAEVTAEEGAATLSAGYNLVTAGASLSAEENITLVSGSSAVDHGNLVDAASLTVTNGDIALLAARTNKVANGAAVTAADGSVSLKGEFANIVSGTGTEVTAGDGAVSLESAVNLVDGARLDAVGSDGTVAITGLSNVIRNASDVQADAGISIDSTGAGAGAGNAISSSTVQTTGGDVNINAANINHVDKGTVKADSGAVAIDGLSNAIGNESLIQAGTGVEITSTGTDAAAGNVINASTVQTSDGEVSITAVNINVVAESEVNAGTGSVAVSGASNVLKNGASVVAGAGAEISSDGTGKNAGNLVSASSVLAESGDVELMAENHNHVTAAATVMSDAGSVNIAGAGNTIDKGSQVDAAQDVNITGNNSITSDSLEEPRTSIIAREGDISLSDSNDIRYATIDAQGTEGDVYITTGAGKSTSIEDSQITGETVTISGESRDNLAVVKGGNMSVQSSGEDAGAGITLDNVAVQDTGMGAANIAAVNGGNMVVENRVDVSNGSLTIAESSASGVDESAGRILVDGSNVLNMKAASSLEGRLSGAGSINKSGGDELLLNHDHREFSGTIYANGAEGGPEGSVADADNAGSWIKVTDAGVGAAAEMVLRNTDLVIGTTETQIGSLDTTQDAESNNAATGATLLADGSYTADDNARADFSTIGSVVEVNKGVAGDVVRATDMKLSDATLLKLDATVDAEGNAASDRIDAGGSINVAAAAGLNSTSTAAAPSTARVYINHTDAAAAANAAEGARTTIMTGTMASDINEDVLYDVEKSANGTYQRTLRDRNVHLENNGDSVDLVFSRNYRSVETSGQLQQVANALSDVSDAFHHSEGWLAASDDQMARLIDAFDYTRSEGAALRGLQSVAGTGAVLPQLMLFDSSRHHLNNLRRQMQMPVCPLTWKGAASRKANAWVAYTGAHDSLGGDANLGDYSRTANGALLGVDTSVSCKLRVGLSLGYENSSAHADSTKVDADTFFVDAYATAFTGHIKHRASIGVATTSFDTRRAVAVDAGYHSFHGSGQGDIDALTLNFGYEISSDYKLSERSWLTRFAALNLAWHDLDSLREEGLGTAGLVTEYDSEWQADVSLGVAYNREFAAVKYEAPAVFYAHAALHVELLADRADATNRFEGYASSWKIRSMEREPLFVELGAGVSVPLNPAWAATAGAAAEIGPDHTSFSGSIGARYQF